MLWIKIRDIFGQLRLKLDAQGQGGGRILDVDE